MELGEFLQPSMHMCGHLLDILNAHHSIRRSNTVSVALRSYEHIDQPMSDHSTTVDELDLALRQRIELGRRVRCGVTLLIRPPLFRYRYIGT